MNKYKQWGRSSGWWGESERHRLARLGYKTGTKITERKLPPYLDPIAHVPMVWGTVGKDFVDRRGDREKVLEHLKKQGWKLRHKSYIAPGDTIEAWKGKNYMILTQTHWNKLEVDQAFIRDKDVGERLKTVLRKPYPYRIDESSKKNKSQPIDYSLTSKLKEFIDIKITDATPDHLEDNPKVKEAKRDIQKIDHPSKLKEWAIKHKNTLVLLGLGSTAIVLGGAAGVPTLMQNTVTGEIVAVGGTLLGRAGQITGTALTGMGVLEEAKVIQKDVFQKHLVKPEELEVVSPKPKAFIIKATPKQHIDTSRSELSDTPESLAEISSQSIPYHKLTKKERDVLFSSVNKVKKLLSKSGKSIKFNKNNLQVVKRVGPDNSAYGAHQGNLIQIDRDTLKDRDKTEGVLLHESIHKVYDVRDETRDLENLHIDYLGLAM